MEFLSQNSCKFLVMLVLQSPELAFGCAGCTGVYLGVFEHLSVDESPSEFESAYMSIGGLNVK